MLLLFFNHATSNIKASKILENTLSEDSVLVLSRSEYKERLYGFWLDQCIANWTGLVTEMDKIVNIGDIKTGEFYTIEDFWYVPLSQNNLKSQEHDVIEKIKNKILFMVLSVCFLLSKALLDLALYD